MENNFIVAVDHIGIAVEDLNEARSFYESLGYHMTGKRVYEDEERNVQMCFMELGSQKIELVSPLKDESGDLRPSPVDRYINSKTGYRIYHICYTVSDVEKQIAQMKKDGHMLLHPLKPAVAMGGRGIAYLYHKKLGLTELAEEERERNEKPHGAENI